jgi:3-phosphoglycerate kinase
MSTLRTLADADFKGKTVFYRADYNVPLENGVIKDPFRITSSFPTLDYLMEQGAKIVICTHIGKPDGKEVPALDVRPIAEFLAAHYTDAQVHLAHKLNDPQVKNSIEGLRPGDILLLPNIRFYKEEEANDQDFAKQLSEMADVYVNDAFACDHRAHASIVGVPSFIDGYAGLLVQKEIESLGNLTGNPEHPFVVIMGGAKVSDKIEVIRSLAQVADTILIGGAMANTFLLAKGEDISNSKAEPEKVEVAKQLLEEFSDKLVLAEDFVKDTSDDGSFRYLDIGSKAIEQFKTYLKGAKTIFWNGSLGYAEDPRYAVATDAIAHYVSSLKGVTTVVAGGDTVENITRLNLHESFSFISTGGGAALEFLGGQELPGIEVLKK